MLELSDLLNMQMKIMKRQFDTYIQVWCWKRTLKDEKIKSLNINASLKNHSLENKKGKWGIKFIGTNFIFIKLYFKQIFNRFREGQVGEKTKIDIRDIIRCLIRMTQGQWYKHNLSLTSHCLLEMFSEVISFCPSIKVRQVLLLPIILKRWDVFTFQTQFKLSI